MDSTPIEDHLKAICLDLAALTNHLEELVTHIMTTPPAQPAAPQPPQPAQPEPVTKA
jgi:hypothetical protein